MLRGLLAGVLQRLVGAPDRLPRRAIGAGIVVLVAIAAAGAFFAAQSGLEGASTSSSEYLRPLLELATNTWTYVLLLAFVLRGILLARNRRYAQQAATVTGYMPRSVRRLAYEAKEADGTTRVIATSADDRDTIRKRLLAALDGADDLTLEEYRSLLPEETTSPEDAFLEDGDLEAVLEEQVEDLWTVLAALERHESDLEAELSEVGRKDYSQYVAGADTDGAREVQAAVDELRETVDLEVTVLDEIEDVTERRDGTADVTRPEPDAGAVEESTDEASSWTEEWKLLKLDLATSLNFERILWQFAVPALVSIVAILIVVQFWVTPVLYPAIGATGILVGALNYLYKRRKRSNRLSELRQETETVQWDDVAVLVKEVSVPETTLQYAWLAGHVYVHDDREEFADEVAQRAYELVHGLDPSPSIMERQAEQIRGMKPDLHGFRDQQRKLVMERLLEHVQSAQNGLIPKAKLIEDVVEYDVAPRRFAPGKRGQGHDPELVREAYRDLVPAALVEQSIALSEDSDREVTAVRLRSDPIPPEYGAIRAQFSSQFGNYADWEPLYDLPDVDDRLDHEPVYASAVGRQRGGA